MSLDKISLALFQIHFEAERGDHYQGDIAIDDITVWPGKCSISDSVGVSSHDFIACHIVGVLNLVTLRPIAVAP